jgi:hypothetical protein
MVDAAGINTIASTDAAFNLRGADNGPYVLLERCKSGVVKHDHHGKISAKSRFDRLLQLDSAERIQTSGDERLGRVHVARKHLPNTPDQLRMDI